MESPLAVPFGDRRVTLEHLRVFVAIAEGMGFGRASSELDRTQPALTQSLRRLEEVLACRLLERRQGHVLGLTAQGQRFLPQAKEILARVSDAVAALQKPALSGRIRLGVPDDFSVVDIHGALSRCLETNPRLSLQVTSALSATIRRMLDADELDVAILKQPGPVRPAAARTIRVLGIEQLCWAGREAVPFDGLPELPLATFPDGCAYRAIALDCLKAAGKAVSLAYTSASYENISRAAASGLGIAVLPRRAVGAGHVVLGPAEGFPELPGVDVVMAFKADDVLSRHFADFLEQAPSFADRWT